MIKRKIGLVLCIILLIYFIGGIIYNFGGIRKEVINEDINSVQIKGYEYICKDYETKIYKDEFNILKNNLEGNEINYSEYANSVAKLFIIDLYTLNNKKNMYDVGGVEFVYPNVRDNYKLNVENTLYKYMEDNSDGNRKQDLPEVSEIIVNNQEEVEYKIGEETFNGYKISLDVKYVKDLKYDNKAEVILVKQDNYIYVVEKN